MEYEDLYFFISLRGWSWSIAHAWRGPHRPVSVEERCVNAPRFARGEGHGMLRWSSLGSRKRIYVYLIPRPPLARY